jgi:hypothetical protein
MGNEHDEPSISASLFGQSVAAKGTSAIIILVLCLFGSAVSYLLYDRAQMNEDHLDAISLQYAKARDEQTHRMATEHTAIVEGMQALKEVNETISTGLNEQNFIILSDEKERKEIKKGLTIPSSLRKKLNP